MVDGSARRLRPGGDATAARWWVAAPHWILLGALAIAPALFTRATVENFEFPKVELWITVALFLLAHCVASEGMRAAGEGARRWLLATPERVTRFARGDPAGCAIILFMISAVGSTVASIPPS